MNEMNVNKLARLINQSITEGRMIYDIQDPLYQSLYLDIFFDEMQQNDSSTMESVSEKLVNHIDLSEPNAEEALEAFMTVWSAWLAIYSELKQRNMLNTSQKKTAK